MTQYKIVNIEDLNKKLKKHRRDGKRIVFTNGCFDVLHYGHVSYLESSKGKNRILIVGLNSDSSIKKIKGANRPIIPQKQRARVLAALESVDYVTIFSTPTPLKLIEKIKPDVLIKGADWKGKGIVGEQIVRANGGKIEYIKFEKNCSTTNIIETIKKSATDR